MCDYFFACTRTFYTIYEYLTILDALPANVAPAGLMNQVHPSKKRKRLKLLPPLRVARKPPQPPPLQS
jgi:hypothetical protein